MRVLEHAVHVFYDFQLTKVVQKGSTASLYILKKSEHVYI